MNDSFPNDDDSLSPKSSFVPNGVAQQLEPSNNVLPNDPGEEAKAVSKPRIYCLNTKQHKQSRPSASQDLLALYGLSPLANAVSRFDPVTGKKNAMRRSYQGHIKDLPGKNIIKPDSVIRDILRVPESEADTFVGPRHIRKLERETLEGFGVMPGVIPDFDPSLLGLDDDLTDHYGDGHREGDESDALNNARRKKKRRSEDTDIDALSGGDERKKKRKKNVLTFLRNSSNAQRSEDETGFPGVYR